MNNVTVHILYRGQALCGFSQDVPARWPPGNVWDRDTTNATCTACIDVFREMSGEDKAPKARGK